MHCRRGRGKSNTGIVRVAAGKRVALLHLFNRLAEYSHDCLKVRLGVCRSQKAGIALLNMNPLLAHRVVKQTGETCIAIEGEIKPGCEVMNPAWNTPFYKEIIERCSHLHGLLVQAELKLRTGGLQVVENKTSYRESKWMPNEGPGKEGDTNFRYRCVAILPCSSIECIHKLSLACEDTNRVAAPHDLAIS